MNQNINNESLKNKPQPISTMLYGSSAKQMEQYATSSTIYIYAKAMSVIQNKIIAPEKNHNKNCVK